MRKLFLPLLLLTTFLLSCVFTTQAQVFVIAEESFGETNYDVGAPAKAIGYATHWNYTEVKTFTSLNGNIIGGQDSSVRIMNYDNTNVYPANYPNPSKGDYIMVVNKPASYKGSWDTVIYSGINISDKIVDDIAFGYVVSRNFIAGQHHATINVKYRIDSSDWVQLDTTKIINDTLLRNKWQYVKLPVKKSGSKLDVMIYSLTTEQAFVDDIRILGTKAPKMTAEETFGETNYDVGAPAKAIGYATHWNYTEVKTFTSLNGNIIGGQDSSVRIMNYDNTNVYPLDYPNPSKGDYIMVVNKPASYKGSWDTVIYSGINISKKVVDEIAFGYVVSRNFIAGQHHATINVKYRIDSSDWVQLDTTKIINDTLLRNKWQYVKLPVGRTGSKIDVLIYSLTTEQAFVDDIRVITSDAPLELAKETFGETNYDVGAPAKTIGYATHWNYNEVKTFTSLNGNIIGGQDSSVRIMNYDNTNLYPANYPNPSKGDYIMLVNKPASYKGSWDTVIYSGINIADKSISAIEFGYVVSRNFIGIQNHPALNVMLRVDSGKWVQLDTSVINKDTLMRNKWQYVNLKTENINGKKLDVLFYSLTTEQAFVDDITIKGYSLTDDEIVKVEKITIAAEGGATTVTSLNPVQMTATITPDSAQYKIVRWKVIAGTGGAVIDPVNGKLTAIKKSNGTIFVVATAVDGSKVTDTLEMTIDLPPTKITKITVTSIDSSTTITSAEARLQMVAIIEPEDATNKNVTWTITNGTGEATLFQGTKVKPVANGTITVTATAQDGSSITGSIGLTIDLPIVISVSNIANSSINIYPNPSSDRITVSNATAIKQVDIFSIEGRLIKSLSISSEQASISLAELNAGIYSIRITTNTNEVLVSKIVKR